CDGGRVRDGDGAFAASHRFVHDARGVYAGDSVDEYVFAEFDELSGGAGGAESGEGYDSGALSPAWLLWGEIVPDEAWRTCGENRGPEPAEFGGWGEVFPRQQCPALPMNNHARPPPSRAQANR